MTRQVPIEFDSSNQGCYITYAELTYQGAMDLQYDEVYHGMMFPTMNCALSFFHPQIRGEWKLHKEGGFEADVKRNSCFNINREGQAQVIHIRLRTSLLMAPDDCISEEASIDDLVAEDR